MEFIAENSVGIILIFISALGLFGKYLLNRHQKPQRHVFIHQVISFLLYSCIIFVVFDFLSELIMSFKLKPLTSSTVKFTGITIIIILFIRKSYIMIDFFEQKQIQKGRDITDSRVISKILKITVVSLVLLMYGEHFGMSLSGLLAFGGIGGIAVGMASKDVLSNFFSGVMLYFDRPFSIGDWIRSPDRNIEGTVTEIGWRMTKITTFDHRPMYVPNSVFSSISVENPGRMTNRRINTVIGLRYEDADKTGVIVDAIRTMLKEHPGIDQSQTLLVYFNEFADSSLNIMIYCFTRTTVWQEWLAIQQEIYLKIINIIQSKEADFAYPSQTIYLPKD
ncbi:mechanosensitive ion channel family protein [Citrobacter sedlakii]|nr:mechanosensitive ion channel family protein [Citrobacter sedlakii]MCZ4677315.1 mechanosensitive ion channel family protein [Citrobacter sedlakii]MDR5007372.1 mechanosensitive ion channel family protein [Citrobacter sedlakii]